MAEPVIKMSLKQIIKSYVIDNVETKILDKISFDVYENEFVVILGPGLCGKTVLLNIMAGLEKVDSGQVLLNGRQLDGPQRTIGMVFQKTGLFPWKTVINNVEFGPKMRGVARAERREKAKYFLELVGLKGFENYYPNQLSGGMKQRVGIARAYANDTDLLLMDEPFGALDAQTRYFMENEILKIWEREKRTVVFVTNNIEEALYLGDRVLLLSSCPTVLKEVYIPDMKKPRNYVDLQFLQYRKIITENTDLAI